MEHKEGGRWMKRRILWNTFALFSVGALATLFAFQPDTAMASITSQISQDTSGLTSAADSAGSAFVSSVRAIAIVVAIALLLWIGVTLFFSGSAQAMGNMKLKIGGFVLALILAFKTEDILSWMFGILGAEVPSFIMFFF